MVQISKTKKKNVFIHNLYVNILCIPIDYLLTFDLKIKKQTKRKVSIYNYTYIIKRLFIYTREYTSYV